MIAKFFTKLFTANRLHKNSAAKELTLITSLPNHEHIQDLPQLKQLLQRSYSLVIESDGVRVIVVKDRRTKIVSNHSKVQFIDVDFPSRLPGVDAGQFIYFDRGCKYFLALKELRKLEEHSYIMFYDCDDLLETALTKVMNFEVDGFFARSSTVFDFQSKRRYQLKPFYAFCGSCHIFNSNVLLRNYPNKVSVKVNSGRIALQQIEIDMSNCWNTPSTKSMHDILQTVDNNFLCYILGDHGQKTLDLYAKLGVRFVPIDNIVTWQINHGQNHGGFLSPEKDSFLFSKMRRVNLSG